MSRHGGYNPIVAEALGHLGVDAKHKEKKELEERPRVAPAVAALLREEAGVNYGADDIAGAVNEAGPQASPLDAPGSAPMAGSTGAGDKSNAQQPPAANQGAQGAGGGIKLKDNASSGTTLDDLSTGLGKVSEAIRDMETLMQTLRRRGNDVKKHKAVLGEFLEDIDKTLRPFREMTK